MPLYPPATTTGYTPGGTDVAVADGGTGASTAAAAATNLGLGTGDSPQFTAVNIGAATDTTVTRTGAGDIAVEGNALYRAGGTDVAVADGGTGSSTAANARTALGLAIGSDVDGFASTIGQAEAEAGVATTVRNFTAQRVAQAIAALASGTGAVATDAIWDAKGDLAGGTGANTAAKLTVGVNDTILMADSGQSTGLKWVGSQTPSTQAFSDAAAEGTADTYARGDHKHAMMANPGGGASLSYQQSFLGGDVSISSTNTFYDGPTVTLSAGTWFITARLNFLDPTGGQGILSIKLWDGSTVAANGVAFSPGTAAWLGGHVLEAVVVIASGTPTWKISAASQGTAVVIKASLAAAANLSGNFGSSVTAIQIA